MSRVGQQPIEIPDGVSVEVQDREVKVKDRSPTFTTPECVDVAVEGGKVTVTRQDETDRSRSLHGLARSMIANMVEGTANGFSKTIEIEGVGYRAAVQAQTLELTVGFSQPVKYAVPDGVTISLEGNTTIIVSGPDKQKVGNTAAEIRNVRPAEPYKGKGLKYKGERVRRKVGKTVA